MLSLQTIVLAAVTALPFTVPAGYSPFPAQMFATSVSSWVGPESKPGAQTLTVTTMPFPLTVDALANGTKAGAKMLGSTMSVVSVKKVTLCGNDGRVVTTRFGSGADAKVVEQESVVKDGFATTLSYTYAATTAADPGIVKALNAFCPAARGEAPTLDLPVAWKTKGPGNVHIVGAWMGSGPGEMLMLMKGQAATSLDTLASSARHTSSKSGSSENIMHVFRHEKTTMCGNPGLIVGVKIDLKSLPITTEMAVTQAAGTSYVLSYMRMGTAPKDPQAEAALTSLCAGTAAAPAASSAPVASPTPTP